MQRVLLALCLTSFAVSSAAPAAAWSAETPVVDTKSTPIESDVELLDVENNDDRFQADIVGISHDHLTFLVLHRVEGQVWLQSHLAGFLTALTGHDRGPPTLSS